jgi:hypothetical protein
MAEMDLTAFMLVLVGCCLGKSRVDDLSLKLPHTFADNFKTRLSLLPSLALHQNIATQPTSSLVFRVWSVKLT